MPLETKVNFPHILQSARPVPEGWQGEPSISVEWVAKIVLDLKSQRYDGVIFKKDDKSVYLPWDEIEKRLGIEW
jgi:hypothetical protein